MQMVQPKAVHTAEEKVYGKEDQLLEKSKERKVLSPKKLAENKTCWTLPKSCIGSENQLSLVEATVSKLSNNTTFKNNTNTNKD